MRKNRVPYQHPPRLKVKPIVITPLVDFYGVMVTPEQKKRFDAAFANDRQFAEFAEWL